MSQKAVLRRAPGRRNQLSKARRVDRYAIYQRAVQDPAHEIQFMRDVFFDLRGRQPRHLREDFCGTALVATAWVKQGPGFTAEAFDLDPEPLAWARAHHVGKLGRRARRLKLVQKDVRDRSSVRPEVRCAQNFSYSVFHTRAELVEYFASVYRDLARDGVFLMDLWGGSGATDPVREARRLGGGVTYVWEQERYEPVTSAITCHIHFRFNDGSQLKQAFSYDWRFWHLPELRDALQEAGFRQLETYFEKLNKSGNGTGEFEKDPIGPVEAQYIAYLIAAK